MSLTLDLQGQIDLETSKFYVSPGECDNLGTVLASNLSCVLIS